MNIDDLSKLSTEGRKPNSMNIDMELLDHNKGFISEALK